MISKTFCNADPLEDANNGDNINKYIPDHMRASRAVP